MIVRRKTREVKVGNIKIGGENKISAQSMLNAAPGDFEGLKNQVAALKYAGCDIVRMAVVDFEDVKIIGRLKELAAADKNYDLPLVADIHFNHRLAIESAYAGIDKIRINPGNIGGEDRVKLVAEVCGAKKIPIRIGVNGGSLEESILAKYQSPVPEALAESAAYNIKLLEKYDFTDIIVSAKSSDVDKMIKTNFILAEICDYPMHIGVTEAGTAHRGLIKNAVGIGSLLQRGIGDTIRVSLTASPVLEVYEGIAILKSLGLYNKSIDIISCPTCGRCRTDVISVANEVEKRIIPIEKKLAENIKIKIAVMGCAVNGPGEAKEADVGIAGGRSGFLLFKKGEPAGKIPAEKAVDILIEEVEKLADDKRKRED
ncbi:MAG: flavodoxin-dependent (E)-4-hydroxy-3-methylbut-2-enyl-diphosphate synthase [Oscillospiraceae bacterium]|nr:flavodoxin-dependent (E)-4-hydroxy-3-methylbut-2-enyl-diphosphate synthase [Oscillospiraceae bacterium]